MSSTATPTPTRVTGRRTARRALAVVGAPVAALALWTLADPVAGIDLAARLNGTVQPVAPAAVVAASLIAGLAAWSLRAVLDRALPASSRAWTIIAVAVLLLSLAGPLTSATGTASTLTLTAMHLLVATILIPVLRRPSPTR